MKKPSLVNLGRHVSELIDVNKLTSSEASLISVDFTNIDATCEVINNLLNDEKLRAENIEIINKCSNPWSAVGLEYSRYFKGL